MKHWYLVQTRARQEFVARENLGRQQYEIFLPTLTQNRRTGGKWQGSVQPFFPGYLFVHLDTETENSSSIRSTRGVLRLVRFGLEPQPVPGWIVEEIQQRVEQINTFQSSRLPLKRGDRVRIMQGTFRGIEAIFDADTGNQRVSLLLHLLGKAHRVSLKQDDISPVGNC